MIDITQLSPAQLDRFLHLQAAHDRQRQDHARLRDLRAYYDGDHPVLLTLRQQEFLGGLLTGSDWGFSHNLVKSIVDTLRERLQVTGLSVDGQGPDPSTGRAAGDGEDEPDPAAALAALLWQWWTGSKLDSQQNRLYKWALRDGRAYVEVGHRDGRPQFTIYRVDDGKTGVTYHRDPEDPNRVLFANRYFYTGIDPLNPGRAGVARKTTYLPDQIRKYVATGDGWQPHRDPGDPGWPLPWVDGRGQPLGIPIVEFENPDGSEVAQVIGLQNALNKSWLDLIAAADSAGFPLVAIEYQGEPGAFVEDDSDLAGADEVRLSPGRAIEVDNARVHRLEASNLAPMIEVIWTLTAAIAGVSRTPQYYLRPQGGADVPSGEALKQLESGLVQRAEERQLVFGQTWADVFGMAVRVHEAFTSGFTMGLEEDPVVGVGWADPNVRNERAAAETARVHKDMGVPDEKVFQLLGYTPAEIAGWNEAQRAERAAQVAQIAAAIQVQQRRNAPQTDVTG